MKRVLIFIFIFFTGILPTFAIYDFMETPDEYERFKEFYDLRTEYWRYIPNNPYDDNVPVIEFKNINRLHDERKIIIKDANTDNTEIIIQ